MVHRTVTRRGRAVVAPRGWLIQNSGSLLASGTLNAWIWRPRYSPGTDGTARDLPWRAANATPWAVLVSEIMLQQTPVARVEPAYARLAGPVADTGVIWRAPGPADAVRQWGQLGYPRRALRLQECAVVLTERFAGEVPADVDSLVMLPGVGSYTARAVAAFAYRQRHPVVHTNVRRLIARAIRGQAQAGPAAPARDHAEVASLLPLGAEAAARLSVALMELGALVCTARSPRCPSCPLAGSAAPGAQPAHRSTPGVRRGGSLLRRHRPSGPRSAARRASRERTIRSSERHWTWSGPIRCSASAHSTRSSSTAWWIRGPTDGSPYRASVRLGHGPPAA